MNELEQRIARQQQRQADRQLGEELRDEAREKLNCGLCAYGNTLAPEKMDSWNRLLDDESIDPAPGISAGAAALVMLEVHDTYRRRRTE